MLDWVDTAYSSRDSEALHEAFNDGVSARLNMPLVVQRLAERHEMNVQDVSATILSLIDGFEPHVVARPMHERAYAGSVA